MAAVRAWRLKSGNTYITGPNDERRHIIIIVSSSSSSSSGDSSVCWTMLMIHCCLHASRALINVFLWSSPRLYIHTCTRILSAAALTDSQPTVANALDVVARLTLYRQNYALHSPVCLLATSFYLKLLQVADSYYLVHTSIIIYSITT